MVEVSLKELSDRATPGEAYADIGDFKLIAHPPGSTFIPDRTLIALCACGEKAGANVHFLAALWTTYRRGKLHDDTALASAVARARREALEEAAEIARARAEACKAAAGEWLGPVDAAGTDPEMAACMSAAMGQCEQVEAEIRALAAATAAEPRQTETETQAVVTAAERAYGTLWRRQGLAAGYAYDARKLLLAVIGKEGQRRGIAWSNEKYGPLGPDPRLMLSDEDRAEMGP